MSNHRQNGKSYMQQEKHWQRQQSHTSRTVCGFVLFVRWLPLHPRPARFQAHTLNQRGQCVLHLDGSLAVRIDQPFHTLCHIPPPWTRSVAVGLAPIPVAARAPRGTSTRRTTWDDRRLPPAGRLPWRAANPGGSCFGWLDPQRPWTNDSAAIAASRFETAASIQSRPCRRAAHRRRSRERAASRRNKTCTDSGSSLYTNDACAAAPDDDSRSRMPGRNDRPSPRAVRRPFGCGSERPPRPAIPTTAAPAASSPARAGQTSRRPPLVTWQCDCSPPRTTTALLGRPTGARPRFASGACRPVAAAWTEERRRRQNRTPTTRIPVVAAAATRPSAAP